MENKANFTKKWWFKVILIGISISLIAQVGLEIDAIHYGVSRDEITSYKREANLKNISLGAYMEAKGKSSQLGFTDVNEYFEAKGKGFEKGEDYKNAKKINAVDFASYQAVLAIMKEKNIDNIDGYLAFKNKDLFDKIFACDRGLRVQYDAEVENHSANASSTQLGFKAIELAAVEVGSKMGINGDKVLVDLNTAYSEYRKKFSGDAEIDKDLLEEYKKATSKCESDIKEKELNDLLVAKTQILLKQQEQSKGEAEERDLASRLKFSSVAAMRKFDKEELPKYKDKCERYINTRSECANAGNIGKCIEIKIGEVEAGMGSINCSMARMNY